MDTLNTLKTSDSSLFSFQQQHHRSNFRQPLRTYSKRILRNPNPPPAKRQRVEASYLEYPLNCQIETSVKVALKKRAISDYFKVTPHHKSPITLPISTPSPDPPEEEVITPPSSPPPLQSSPFAPCQKSRPRRRLTTKPTLPNLMDLSGSGDNKHGHKDSKSAPFAPESQPPKKSYLGKDSPPGLRKAAQGGTSSEEDSSEEQVSYPGSISIVNSSRLPPDVPFAPSRRHLTHDMSSHASNSPDKDENMSSMNVEVASTAASDGDLQGTGSESNQMVLTTGAIADGNAVDTHTLPDYLDSGNSGVTGDKVPAQSSVAVGSGSTIGNAPTVPVQTPEILNLALAMPAASASVQQNPQTATGYVLSPLNIAVVPALAANNQPQGAANMIQSVINVGSTTIITCPTCDHVHNTAIHADVTRHNRYHASFVFGVPVGSLDHSAESVRTIDFQSAENVSYIVSVGRFSSDAWKAVAEDVLRNHVNSVFNSAVIPPEVLWSGLNTDGAREGRFTVYLYVTESPRGAALRVVGLLLAEMVCQGFEYGLNQLSEDEFGEWPPIVSCEEVHLSSHPIPVYMGVSVIWVLRSRRRQGFATQLLDAARHNFVYGVEIMPDEIAWTGTTDDGAALVRSYTNTQDDRYIMYFDN